MPNSFSSMGRVVTNFVSVRFISFTLFISASVMGSNDSIILSMGMVTLNSFRQR